MKIMRNFYKKFAMVCTTIALFTFVAVSQTLKIDCNASLDDAEERLSTVGAREVGSIDEASSDLELIFDKEPQAVGQIFRNVTIPKNATITNAYVQFTVDALSAGTTDAVMPPLEVYGVLEAKDATPFSTTPFDVTSRPKTTAKVTGWIMPPSVAVGDAGVNERTPDLKTIIQEIVNQTAWTSGNSITIVVTGDPGGTADINREMEAAVPDGGGGNSLNITYTAGTAVEKIGIDAVDLIYPNPSNGIVNIKNPSTGKFGYSIYTFNGKMVASKSNLTGSTTEVDMSSKPKGTYFINVKAAERTVKNKLILK